IFLGDPYIVEKEGMGVTSADSQFVFLGSDFKTRHSFLDKDRIYAVMSLVDVCLGNYQEHFGPASIGDPIFCTVKQIVVPLVDGRCFLGGGITSGFRLGEAKG